MSRSVAMAATWLGLALLAFSLAGLLAWADLQYITESYHISQAQEIQKQYLDVNRKLRIELASLTSIHRLEQLAAEYGMAAPQPTQVVNLPLVPLPANGSGCSSAW